MSGPLIAMLASGAIGLAVIFAALTLLMGTMGKRNDHPERGSFEADRRAKVRKADPTFRLFEPWIEELAPLNQTLSPKSVKELQDMFRNADEDSIWRADEYLAARQVEGILLGSVLGVFCFWVSGSIFFSIVTVPLIAYGFSQIMVMTLKSKVTRKVQDIKRRLSFAIDLMALMMEAGAGFRDSLEAVSIENEDHPLGVELHRCSQQLQRGRTISEVLEDFGTKIKDEDVRDFVYAMVKGNELGTPLTKILRTQAEQMRLRRSQWAEKDAAQAQVKIIFPGMIIMIACLLIVLGQFMLPAVFSVME